MVYAEVHDVKNSLEREVTEFEEAKKRFSMLRRQNFVLWKHILKQRKRLLRIKKRAKKRHQTEYEDEQEDQDIDVQDSEIGKVIENELAYLADDPDLIEDLKKI